MKGDIGTLDQPGDYWDIRNEVNGWTHEIIEIHEEVKTNNHTLEDLEREAA